jgi:hypothetical protein
MAGYKKIIKSGNVIEIYTYEKTPRLTGRKHSLRKAPSHSRHPITIERRFDNIKRLRKGFIRLVRSNTGRGDPNALITLTMSAIVDITTASRHFNQFTTKLRKAYGTNFRYIGVPEFQTRGAVHFHVLYWGLPSNRIEHEGPYWEGEDDIGKMDKIQRGTRFIQNLWAYGYVDCVSTDGSEKLAGYLAKYMSKAMLDDRLLRKRAYYCSRNIYRPDHYTHVAIVSEAELIWGKTPELVSERDFHSLWLGNANYKRIELKDIEINSDK